MGSQRISFVIGLEVDIDDLERMMSGSVFGREAHVLDAPFGVLGLYMCSCMIVVVLVVGEDRFWEDDDSAPTSCLVVVVEDDVIW